MINTQLSVTTQNAAQPSAPTEQPDSPLSNATATSQPSIATNHDSTVSKADKYGGGGESVTTHIDPATRSRADSKTEALALEQTQAARNLFYNPGPIAEQQLGMAANQLGELMDMMPNDEMRGAISARLIGNEGLMKGQSIQDVRSALSRVTQGAEASANDRGATVELMGGIGALFADTGATTGMQSRSQSQSEKLRDFLADHIPLLSDSNITEMKELGDSKVTGPLKSQQRKRPSPDAVPRFGMHDLGAQADKNLGIAPKNALGSVSWQLATIDKNKVASTAEPLSGHMSGSPSEALATFDALLGNQNEKPYVKAHTQTRSEAAENPSYVQKQAFHSQDEADVKSARAAWATGYLVATGFHSSVEVAESALKYSGQNPRPEAYSGTSDAADWLGDGAATAMIKELHESHSKTP
ncbi:hypothetical protein GV054_02350 [Marinomonas mediterranea]|uniref:hypothetical protein n=1 Tax=Marinomonas mediterranea TaxID=119864 RepID=UPI0023499D93|nr:hypothetical protein [Marinomonas mediterranea]WCN11940.1 hypothetical protein GV054_02350 [Marinomonas mediterranea]